MASSFQNLPPELIDSVFHYLSKKEILACSLVCNYLLPQSRRHFFHTLYIISLSSSPRFSFHPNVEKRCGPDGIADFQDLLKTEPSILTYIQHLHVEVNWDWLFFFRLQNIEHTELLEVLQTLCPLVDQFTLKLKYQVPDSMRYHLKNVHDALWKPFVLQNVTMLVLEGIESLPFDIARCSNLAGLTLRQCTFNVDDVVSNSNTPETSMMLTDLTSLDIFLDEKNLDRSLCCAESVLQFSARSIERLKLIVHPGVSSYHHEERANHRLESSGAGQSGVSSRTIQKVAEGITGSKFLSLASLPSLRHLVFEIVDDMSHQEDYVFHPIAQFLRACAPNTKLSSISLFTTLHVDHSQLPQVDALLSKDLKRRDWQTLDGPLYDLGEMLQRPISVKVHAQVKVKRDSVWGVPKKKIPVLQETLIFDSLFRNHFLALFKSEFLSLTYDWTIDMC
ncbi:hypothetical protein CPB83DRAFT_888975 [Crepidotus variabilis]|uniref:F-box domain-containing protein n=1 Tax=Crepidotus variabilis TaxID=179855 RepID=A0A9P6ES16_9AGAR|nr:hypothetical protein CPB83DRAFT_888975 [Crepidotus variabilis]